MIKVERCRRNGCEGIAVEVSGSKENVLTEWAAATQSIYEVVKDHEGEEAAKKTMTEVCKKALTENFEKEMFEREEPKSVKSELIECVEELLDFLKK